MQQAAQVLSSPPRFALSRISVKTRAVSLGVLYGAAFCFLAASVVNVWAAYNGELALQRFFHLLSGVLLVMVAPLLGARIPLRVTASGIPLLTSLMVMVVALAYLAQQWGGASWLALLPTWLQGGMSDNLAAQMLAMALPLVAAAVWSGIYAQARLTGAIGLLALLLGVAALALTGSRGAWLGVVAGGAVALYLALRVWLRRHGVGWRWMLDVAALLIVLAALALYSAIVALPALDAQLGVSAQGGSALSRIALWRDSVPLIEDYFFTGSGLGSTAMVYATYAYLLHVPYLYHAHNLYVQVALEQGAPALLAWVALIGAAAFYAMGALRVANRTGRPLLIAAFAALTVLLVHGLFEAELYSSALAGLLFYAPAVLVGSAASIYVVATQTGRLDVSPAGAVSGIGLLVGASLPLLIVVLLPGAAARWEANLGAVLQTQAELSIYRRPDWSFQDQVRRQLPGILAPAEAHFAAALAIDPAQATAHRRLGEIALAQGDFALAQLHLTAAHAAAPQARATRQLLGEILALQGDVEGATALWRGLDVGQGQFLVREWWYQAFGRPDQVERLNDAIQAYQRTQ